MRSRPLPSRFSARSSAFMICAGVESRHSLTSIGQAVLAGQRALAEVLRDDLGQRVDRERVAGAGGDVDRADAVLGRVRGGGEAGVGDEVDGDDVHPDRAVGGEAAGDDPGAVAEQDRVGDLQRLHPARVGRGERGLDDRRAHDRQLPRLGGDQPALAHRLRERVGVAPAERPGALAAALDELLVDPAVRAAAPRGRRPRGRRPGRRRAAPRARSASGGPAGATRPRCRGARSGRLRARLRGRGRAPTARCRTGARAPGRCAARRRRRSRCGRSTGRRRRRARPAAGGPGPCR